MKKPTPACFQGFLRSGNVPGTPQVSPVPAFLPPIGGDAGNAAEEAQITGTTEEPHTNERNHPMDGNCIECGGALPVSASSRRRYCSDACRYRRRDQRPERKAADAERHRLRYHSDPEFRRRHNEACERRRLARAARKDAGS